MRTELIITRVQDLVLPCKVEAGKQSCTNICIEPEANRRGESQVDIVGPKPLGRRASASSTRPKGSQYDSPLGRDPSELGNRPRACDGLRGV